MRERLTEQLRAVVQALLDEAGVSGERPDFALEMPRDEQHGDFACNAAMLLAKRLRESPRAIAERIAARLAEASDLVERVEVAGPGFVNVWLSGSRWHDLLYHVLEAGPRYGHADIGKGQRVQVEFVSANPTGPLTLGHGRNAVLGDSIARLLEALGYQVTREYYFNNAGRQMRVLGNSVRARYLEQLGRAAPPPPEAMADPANQWKQEIGGLPVEFPQDGYQGEYIAELASELREKHGDALVAEDAEGPFLEIAETRIFEEIRRTLVKIGIAFDVYSNEKDLYEEGRPQAVLDDLRAKDLVYESEGAVWLRATALGLDRDRVLVKSSGEPTYLLPDIAYHREKFRRGFDHVIDVLGADHIEQFPFVVQGVGALGCPKERVELVMYQFVTLTSGGEQVKQSTRRATYVTVDELLEEVGVDVFRYFMLQRRAESHLDFDLDLARDVDWKKNPAYCVQYAHARTHGIERKALELGVALPDAASVDPGALVLPEEIELLRKISEFPELVERAGEAREPHHVAYYARDVAGLWNAYVQDGTRHRVLSDDTALTNARLGLALAVRTVLANALALLGIAAPEQM
ncbi:MAG TPA: arginine--tRNA ligase [Myxococcota bacterium]